MKKLFVIATLLALEGPAEAQTYQTFRQPNMGTGFGSSMTYGPNGVYQTFESPNGSMTFGPNGYNAQTFSSPSGESSMTFVHPGWGDR